MECWEHINAINDIMHFNEISLELGMENSYFNGNDLCSYVMLFEQMRKKDLKNSGLSCSGQNFSGLSFATTQIV